MVAQSTNVQKLVQSAQSVPDYNVDRLEAIEAFIHTMDLNRIVEKRRLSSNPFDYKFCCAAKRAKETKTKESILKCKLKMDPLFLCEHCGAREEKKCHEIAFGQLAFQCTKKFIEEHSFYVKAKDWTNFFACPITPW